MFDRTSLEAHFHTDPANAKERLLDLVEMDRLIRISTIIMAEVHDCLEGHIHLKLFPYLNFKLIKCTIFKLIVSHAMITF